jgi:hypothetical protein
VGLIVGVGSGLGLETLPRIFEPILQVALYALGLLVRAHPHYDPSQRTMYAILLVILGTVWALLFAYAFAREPARNLAIDVYLRREDDIDHSRRATVIADDDQPL